MQFPQVRMRRLRQNRSIRDMLRETAITPNDLIFPYFVCPGENIKNEIKSMPGIYQYSIDNLLRDVEELVKKGLKSVILFGIPEFKDSIGSSGCLHDGIVQKSVRELKKQFQDLYVITDVCNCEYTDHGHCGPIINGEVNNDATLEILAKQAVTHAIAGADMVAPSDMMDGRIQRIRAELDSKDFQNTPIMAYSAKFASSFYGPFRDAAGSTPSFGDRKSYQMDPANAREALREMELDFQESADIIMVKPALSYLDIIKTAKENFNIPIAAYNVSGEYSMVKAAAEKNWIDGNKIAMEILTSIKRAGADLIITYHFRDVIDLL
ncbi:MAG: porphobilinogen synthase [Candidatus Delongbacteria bacterium]|nr:porphobilinogen synthase [Candidatus Delongbacteria bacterium]MBN2833426.1 porphobilinogen synthase [Candidatus Delongbacteria bacterium]